MAVTKAVRAQEVSSTRLRSTIARVCGLLLGVSALIILLSCDSTGNPTVKSESSFDPCESLRELDPHCGWKPHWETSGVSTNAMDGAKTEFLSLQSSDADGMDFGKLHYAELRICFENGKLCKGKHIGVGVEVHGMVRSIGYEAEYSTPVRIKFDDGTPLKQTWGMSEDREMLFPYGREKQLLTQLTQHSKLILEFSYYQKVPRTVTFDLSGLSGQMRTENLSAE